MSPYRFIKWIAEGETIQMFGDGSQSRDFTYVDDIARGTIAAIQDVGYEIINLGGGRNPVSLNTIIKKLESLIQHQHLNLIIISLFHNFQLNMEKIQK